MADFVGDDIGLGKVASGTMTQTQFIVKGQIDIHLLIGRTVERPHRGLANTTGGTHGAGEQYQGGFDVAEVLFSKQDIPGVFGIRQYDTDKISELLLLR